MSITYQSATQTFYLESKNLSYIFRVHKSGFLQHLYFGKRIAREDLSHTVYKCIRGHAANNPATDRNESLDDLTVECPTYGRSDFHESMLAFNVDGVRVGDLRYVDYKILPEKPKIEGMPSLRRGETLQISLQDECNGLLVQLFYTVFEDVSAIARRMVITNLNERPIEIDRAYSFSVDFPDSAWQVLTLTGAHLRERYIQRTDLVKGIYTADSKCGVSSAQMNPFLALLRKHATEFAGEAYGFQLIYSGNFALKTEVGQNGCARVLGGINDYDFSWELAPHESFSTPEAVLAYSDRGTGELSRTLHDLYRGYLIHPKFVSTPRPVVLNNWEATYFDFTEEKLCSLIERVKGTGIDTFVLDDGWFGKRNFDDAGLGDWFINREKLKNGFTPIIECAHKNGLKFGLWFEPEMVNGNSDLYRAHPDWIVHVDGIEPCQGRNQFVLDLTREEVRDYLVNCITKILSENKIDYVKWDMNRSITENYSASLGKRGKEFSHRYVLGLYDLLERLTTRFPDLFIEGCASGGCRFDAGILYYCPQIWTSDNTDAYSRAIIQYGTSMCYPLSAMSCHVSVCPNHQTGRTSPFESRTEIAHLGATGYELDPTKLSDEDLKQIKADVQKYREDERLILDGDLYRLNSPLEENLFAEMVVSKDKKRAKMTIMKPLFEATPPQLHVYPQGLDETKTYTIKELNLTLQGSTLINAGIVIYLPWNDFQTKTIWFEECENN